MRKKTSWTVAAGTTAAVLVPGVAFALVAGGPSLPTTGPGVGHDGGSSTVQKPDVEQSANTVSAPSANDPAPQEVPAVETMTSAGSAASPASPAVAPSLSAQSAQSTAPAPAAPKPAVQSAQSAPSAQSAQSAQSAASPASAQSADSPDSLQSANDD